MAKTSTEPGQPQIYGQVDMVTGLTDDSRKFLLSSSLLGRDEGDIRRLDCENSGVFAGNLLDHIAGAKADRIKTGADLLVQSARGFTRTKAGT